MPVRSKFSSSCLRLLRPSCKFSTFTHNGAKTYVAKEDCFCLFSLIFFLPKFHMEKITLIKPTWSSGKASVIPLMCLHTGAHSSHPASVTEGKNELPYNLCLWEKAHDGNYCAFAQKDRWPQSQGRNTPPKFLQSDGCQYGQCHLLAVGILEIWWGTFIVVISRGSTSI